MCAGKFHACHSVLQFARAIEARDAMRTDGESERLSEMPADSIAAAATKIDLGTSRWALYVRLHHFASTRKGAMAGNGIGPAVLRIYLLSRVGA